MIDANLVWTDDEIQFLLEVIRDFKADQLYEGSDWDNHFVNKEHHLVFYLQQRAFHTIMYNNKRFF